MQWPVPPPLPPSDVDAAPGRSGTARRLRLLLGTGLLLAAGVLPLLPHTGDTWRSLQDRLQRWQLSYRLQAISRPSIVLVFPQELREQFRVLPRQIEADNITLDVVQIPYSSAASREPPPSFSRNLYVRGLMRVVPGQEGWQFRALPSVNAFWASLGATSVDLSESEAPSARTKWLTFNVPTFHVTLRKEVLGDSFTSRFQIAGGIAPTEPLSAAEQAQFLDQFTAHPIAAPELVPTVLAQTYFLASESLFASGSWKQACQVLTKLDTELRAMSRSSADLLPEAFRNQVRCLFVLDESEAAIELLKEPAAANVTGLQATVLEHLVEPILFDPFQEKKKHLAQLDGFPSTQLAYRIETECAGIAIGLFMEAPERRRRWACVKRAFTAFRDLLQKDSATRRLALQSALQLQFSFKGPFNAQEVTAATYSNVTELCDALGDIDNFWTLIDADLKRGGPMPVVPACSEHPPDLLNIADRALSVQTVAAKIRDRKPLTDEDKQKLLDLLDTVPAPQPVRIRMREWLSKQHTVQWTEVVENLFGAFSDLPIDESEKQLLLLARKAAALAFEVADHPMTETEAAQLRTLLLEARTQIPDPMLQALALVSLNDMRQPSGVKPRDRMRDRAYRLARNELLDAYPELAEFSKLMVIEAPEEATNEAHWLEQVLARTPHEYPDILDKLSELYLRSGQTEKATFALQRLSKMADNSVRRDYYAARLQMLTTKERCFRVGVMYFSKAQVEGYRSLVYAIAQQVTNPPRFTDARQLPYYLAESTSIDSADHVTQTWVPFAEALEPVARRNHLPPGAVWLVVQGGLRADRKDPLNLDAEQRTSVEIFAGCKDHFDPYEATQ